MKKYIAILLTIIMSVSVFTACGKDDTDKSTDKTTTTVAVELPDVTEPASTEDDSNTMNSEEQVTVLDNEYCTLTIDGAEYDEWWGYSINTTFVNKTADKNLVASLECMSVRNVQVNAIYYSEAAPGKTAKENISLVTSDEEAEIIGDKPVFNLRFEVMDADDYFSDPLGQEDIVYAPFGGMESGAYVREPQDSDIVLVDNDSLSMTITAVVDDDITDYTLKIFLTNKTDKELMVSAEDASVNGFMVDPYFAKSIAGGMSAFAEMYWLGDEFEELKISEVKDIEMTIVAYDYDDIFAGDIVNEKVTITP